MEARTQIEDAVARHSSVEPASTGREWRRAQACNGAAGLVGVPECWRNRARAWRMEAHGYRWALCRWAEAGLAPDLGGRSTDCWA